MVSNKQIFRRGPSALGFLVCICLLAITLIVVSTQTTYLDPTRAWLLDLVAPVYELTDVGTRVTEWTEQSTASRDELLQSNRQLQDENLILQRRVMTSAVLQAENARLRQLLGATEYLQESVLIAEVAGTPPDTETHRLIIGRGSSDGLVEGLPVLDADGIFGQIVTLGTDYSEVLLISDRTHALPVEVLRTGRRAIAQGVGDYDLLQLRNIPSTMDLQVGDQIVTSGLGGSFPQGYPVGLVTAVVQTSSSPFLDVDVAPYAGLNTSRQMLVLFSQTRDIREQVFPDSSGANEVEPLGEGRSALGGAGD